MSCRYPRAKKPRKYYSLTYTQSGWKILSIKPIRHGKKKLALLRFTNLGNFKVIIHRNFPIEKIARVTIKLYTSGKLYVIFIMEG